MTNPRIVVGDDGSRAAAEAIRHAAHLAVALGADLEVVRAWTLRTAPRPKDVPTGVPTEDEFAAAVHLDLAEDIERLSLPAGLPVSLRAERGKSTPVLLAAAEGAEMLVVGSRGEGGFTGLLMGSTADQVVRYAKVPVLIVPVMKTADAH